jgi:hypothetical protein
VKKTRLNSMLPPLQIVTAKQPGYFSYYKPPHHIRHIVSNEVLMDKLEEIEDLEDKINNVSKQDATTTQVYKLTSRVVVWYSSKRK